MDESTTNAEPTAGAPGETAGGPGEPAAGTEQDSDAAGWAAQLQRMIDDIGRQAVPVIREVAAKAAELAAVAGEKAGPFAQKAAEKTAEFGAVVAARGHEMATELRRADEDSGAASSDAAPGAESSAEATPHAEPAPAEDSATSA
jgi:hypothetical protein